MQKDKKEQVDNSIIPIKERIKIRNKQIIALYKTGLSMEEVAIAMGKLGHNVSKTTVFFAVKGRERTLKKKVKTLSKTRSELNQVVNKNNN